MKNNLLYLALVFVSLNACSHNSEKECNLLLKKANDSLYQFYLSNDTALLVVAKNCLDSIDCNSLKHKVFNAKITVFILLKEYSEGIKYIKSLNTADFNRPYQKSMCLKSFEAMQSEFKGDTVLKNKLYAEIIVEIQNYLDSHPDQEILVDLFSVKSKIEKHEKIIQEIDLLKKTRKYNNDFLNSIIVIITDANNEVEGVVVPVDRKQ